MCLLDNWKTQFKKLIPYYVLLNSFLILIFTLTLIFTFDIYFVLFSIPVLYLITNIVNGCLFFNSDYNLSKEIGYFQTQRFLWEKWNNNHKTKCFKVLRVPGYDCRIGQLKKRYNRNR